MERILVVDDEDKIRAIIRKYGEFEGYEIAEAHDGMEAVEICRKEDFDLIILDVMMPELDGFSTCREIRKFKEIPVIMLSARGEEYDKIHGFELGIDDYVVKPFSMKVLLKRIEAVIGRNNREKQLACGEIILFPDKKQVYKNEKEIILTAREYQLLEYLMYNQGNVLTKENILEYVWGLDGQFVVDNTVSVTINRLRKKIETDAGSPIYLKNVFGLGYKLECV